MGKFASLQEFDSLMQEKCLQDENWSKLYDLEDYCWHNGHVYDWKNHLEGPDEEESFGFLILTNYCADF